mgnify:CR=1 FL=1
MVLNGFESSAGWAGLALAGLSEAGASTILGETGWGAGDGGGVLTAAGGADGVVDAETALRSTNRKFRTRFKFVEEGLQRAGKGLKEASLDEMETLWQAAKVK